MEKIPRVRSPWDEATEGETNMATVAKPGDSSGSRDGPDNPPKPQDDGSTTDSVHEGLCGLAYLIVGGNRFARTMIKSALNGFGFRNLTECESAEYALKIVRDGGIDAVITEYEMPGMNGAEFVWHMRRLKGERARKLPVVMVSNDAVAVHVRTAIDSGVNEFLPKPYSRRDLYFRLRRAVVSPKPFVVLPGYAGPDRRVADVGAPHGVDRRGGPSMSVQLYALTGSEPKWIKTAKLGIGGAGEKNEAHANPPPAPKPEPGPETTSETRPKPTFSVLAESDVSGRDAGNRLAAAIENRTVARTKDKSDGGATD
jgi:CheY-like chemotaxis protein